MLDNFQLHELSGYTGLERINYLLKILINSKTYYDYVLNSYEQKDYEKKIEVLSGGEKTLTAISLLFAILNVRPVPFCVTVR